MPSRRRLLIWAAGLVVYTVLLVVTGTLLWTFLVFPPWSDEGVFDWLRRSVDQLGNLRWWAYTLPVSAVISLTQYLFLLPVVRLRPPDGTRSRSLSLSLGVGALLAAIITAAIGLAGVELIGSMMHGNFHDDPWAEELFGEVWIWPALVMTLLGSWVFWTMVLLIFARRLWADTVLGRLVVLLLGGTIVELLVVLPIDAMVQRRSDCYCAAGTFWSLCAAAVGLLWLTGPGIVFAVTTRRRGMARRTNCRNCGQLKGPAPGPMCPECGCEWLV